MNRARKGDAATRHAPAQPLALTTTMSPNTLSHDADHRRPSLCLFVRWCPTPHGAPAGPRQASAAAAGGMPESSFLPTNMLHLRPSLRRSLAWLAEHIHPRPQSANPVPPCAAPHIPCSIPAPRPVYERERPAILCPARPSPPVRLLAGSSRSSKVRSLVEPIR